MPNRTVLLFSLVLCFLTVFSAHGQVNAEIRKVKTLSGQSGQSQVRLKINKKNIPFLIDHSEATGEKSVDSQQLVKLINDGEIDVLKTLAVRTVEKNSSVDIIAKNPLPDNILIGDVNYGRIEVLTGTDDKGRELISDIYIIQKGDTARVDYSKMYSEAYQWCTDSEKLCCANRRCKCFSKSEGCPGGN